MTFGGPQIKTRKWSNLQYNNTVVHVHAPTDRCVEASNTFYKQTWWTQSVLPANLMDWSRRSPGLSVVLHPVPPAQPEWSSFLFLSLVLWSLGISVWGTFSVTSGTYVWQCHLHSLVVLQWLPLEALWKIEFQKDILSSGLILKISSYTTIFGRL